MTTEIELQPLHKLFQAQVARTPHAVALVDGETVLTYQQLDETTDKLAGYLQQQGVGPDKIVGILMEKSGAYLLAYIATLKAGGAYMPLELAYPDTLLNEVIEQAQPQLIISKSEYVANLAGETPILQIDQDYAWQNCSYDPHAAEVTLDNLAFMVYTSGTTGTPKGILNPHRAPVHAYQWRYQFSSYQPGDRVACNVFFVWELLRPLLKGGAVYPIPDEIIYDPLPLLEFIARHEITEILFTPSLLETIINTVPLEQLRSKLNSLRVLWLNGEVVTATLRERMLASLPQHTRLLNTYSISECHDVANENLRTTEISPSAICPVGFPNSGLGVQVLDDEQNPVSMGQEGELYVSGPGLAHGYLNKPVLTEQRFIDFAGERFYRTGDLAVLHTDGKLEIRGRCDFMVKIRGYSVHLPAVESALLDHAPVSSCVVLVDGAEGEDKRLVAYVVRQAEATWQVEPQTGRCLELQNNLKPYLPHYMIPNVYVELPDIPINPSTGKLARKQLPPPPARQQSHLLEEIQLPKNPTMAQQQTAMQQLWEYLLQLEAGTVTPETSFFDLGGHSLLAAELTQLVRKKFKRQLLVKDIYEHPTLANLVEVMVNDNGTSPQGSNGAVKPALWQDAQLDPAITPAPSSKPLTLSAAQNIFITGTTGFLGAFLLAELLNNTADTVKIHCLVRMKSGLKTDGLTRIVKTLNQYQLWQPGFSKRIIPVIGDLGQPRLGLSVEKFALLASQVDFIFHCAALVNYVYPYPVLKPSTVDGTQEVLRLACTNVTTPMHYISTNGIFPGGDETPYPETNQVDSYIAELTGGYGRAKWVAEKLVWQAIERGLPVCLYRPGNIGHHSKTGAANPNDFQFMILDACQTVGSAPDRNDWYFELTPVDFLARSIVQFAEEPGHFGQVYNVVQADPTAAKTVFDFMAQQNHITTYMPLEQWKSALTEKATANSEPILQVLAQSLDDIEMYLTDESQYDCSQFDQAVSQYGLSRPDTGVQYFRKLLSTNGD